MQLSPTFVDETSGRNFLRVSFQFTASGTKQSGVLYVTMNIDGPAMGYAEKAAKIAAKRAGCGQADVTLHRIGAPQR